MIRKATGEESEGFYKMRGDMIRFSFCNMTPTMEQRLDGEDRGWRQGSH